MTRSAEVHGIVAFSWYISPLQNFTATRCNIRLINNSPCTIFDSVVCEPRGEISLSPSSIWSSRVISRSVDFCLQQAKHLNAEFWGPSLAERAPWLARGNFKRKKTQNSGGEAWRTGQSLPRLVPELGWAAALRAAGGAHRQPPALSSTARGAGREGGCWKLI